jgi:sugar lactone lactonase YvrE
VGRHGGEQEVGREDVDGERVGGELAEQVAGEPPTVLIDDPELESPAGVAVDASNIYWADSASGIVYERKLSGGLIIPFNLSNQFTDPAGVAVDSTHVYWANSGDGTIKEAPLTGGPVTTLVTGQPSPVGVAVSP